MENENELIRTLTDPAATPLSDILAFESLEAVGILTTPQDCPMVEMLLPRAEHIYNIVHEWVETALNTTYSQGIYDGYDLSGVGLVGGTPARGVTYVMAYAQIARVGGLAQATKTVDGNAMLIELRDKYIQLLRGMEYYIWNGNHGSSALQTNGIATQVTTAVSNGGGALSEAVLQAAVIQAIEDGIMPNLITATPTVCMRVANFTEDRISQYTVESVKGGIGQNSFLYFTPFGYNLQVLPIRPSFHPTGKVFVFEKELLSLVYMNGQSDAVIQLQDRPNTNDGVDKVIKSYFGVKVYKAAKHRVITNVAESLS